jgi:alpha,alpha-trehalase
MTNTNAVLTISKSDIDAVIFDLDGVVTDTAGVHATAWKNMFDGFLKRHALQRGATFEPFDAQADYRRYVDGKPRYDGVKSFLESRDIHLPYGSSDDTSNKETVCGLGNRKNQLFREQLDLHGADVYDSTIEFVQKLRTNKFKTAIVSSSKNCTAILKSAKIGDLFDTKIDGVDAEDLHLNGKPEPDIFIEAAKRLDADPARAVVIEDAIAGVQAGSKGGFALVVGVDRTGQATALKDGGANIVVKDLAEIHLRDEQPIKKKDMASLPSALKVVQDIFYQAQAKRPVIFLDYDGTLTPIVEAPELAVLSKAMRQTLRRLAEYYAVAIISGRDLANLQDRVRLKQIYYAGSHGFDITGPRGRHIELQKGKDFMSVLESAEQALQQRLEKIDGARLERKKFSIAVHYRNVEEKNVAQVEKAVDNVHADNPKLRKAGGKKVYELQPDIDWHKGKALLWLLEKLGLDRPDVLPFYIGDDISDEDAFDVLADCGVSIVVKGDSRASSAQYTLEDPNEVEAFLKQLIAFAKEGNR